MLGISKLNTTVVIPFTSNLSRADNAPNVFFTKEETGLSKNSVALIHLIGAVNKFCFTPKVSRLSETNYAKVVSAVTQLISNS